MAYFLALTCRVYFNAEIDFWYNFSFWRTFRNSYLFCNIEDNLILKLENFLWNKLLSPDQTGTLGSSRDAPTNCMECIKIKRLLVARANATLCRFGLKKKKEQKKENNFGLQQRDVFFSSVNARGVLIPARLSRSLGILSAGDWYLENAKIWSCSVAGKKSLCHEVVLPAAVHSQGSSSFLRADGAAA